MNCRIMIWVILLMVCVSGGAWSAPQKLKPEPFGKSLERLKWDKQKQEAVEKERDRSHENAPVADKLRIETQLAVFDVQVFDKQGHLIAGLGKDDFEAVEDGVAQQIGTFALGDGTAAPRSIILLIDFSNSQAAYLNSSIAAALKLVARLKPKDRMAIVTDNIQLIVPFTSEKQNLNEGLESIRKQYFAQGKAGQSKQYSALLAALRELADEETRPIVIFQTDGDQLLHLRNSKIDPPPPWRPNPLEFGLEDLRKAAELAHATIYSVYPGSQLLKLPAEEQTKRAEAMIMQMLQLNAQRQRATGAGVPEVESQVGKDAWMRKAVDKLLKEHRAMLWLAEQTGGWLEHLETPDQADALYARILDSINNRYILGYYPTNTARDGRWRKVQIKVRAQPDYIVMGRDRYLVPAEAK